MTKGSRRWAPEEVACGFDRPGILCASATSFTGVSSGGLLTGVSALRKKCAQRELKGKNRVLVQKIDVELTMLTDFGKSNPDFGKMRSHSDGNIVLKLAAGTVVMLFVAVNLV
jgi:hypothetical protein